MIVRMLCVLVMLGLAGCATPTSTPSKAVTQRLKAPNVPERLADQGLLLATIAASAVSRNGVEQLSFSVAGVQIDNVYYAGAVHDNYLVLPLKPGTYSLDSLHVYGSLDVRSETRYPLNYKFDVVSGQATNIGAISLVRQRGAEKRYLKTVIDNTADMTAYLRRHYPKLVQTLKPATPVLTNSVKHADATLLEAVRRDIARDAWLSSDDVDTANYAGGEVGTIAKLLRDSQGKVAAFDVFETGTTAAMVSCSGYEQRFVCSSAEPALYFVEGNKVERRAIPFSATHVWVHVFPPRGVVLIDPHMMTYVSLDNGATWTKHAWFRRKDPLHWLARIKSTNGKDGYYLYSTFTTDPLAPQVIYSEFARPAFRTVDIPKISTWQRLLETPHGLFVGPHNTDKKDDTASAYFRPKGQTQWQPRRMPGKHCFYLQRDHENPEGLRILCDSKFYTSADDGRAWVEHVVAKK